jgi:hypothetical protein
MGKTVKVLFFFLPFHISFCVRYARSERSQNTHTGAQTAVFLLAVVIHSRENMNFSGVFFSHLQVMSDLKNLRSLRLRGVFHKCIFRHLAQFPISSALVEKFACGWQSLS